MLLNYLFCSVLLNYLFLALNNIFNPFVFRETVDEMYRGEFDFGTANIALNVEDTGGNYIREFRTMADISLAAADAFVLVYSVAEPETFQVQDIFTKITCQNI